MEIALIAVGLLLIIPIWVLISLFRRGGAKGTQEIGLASVRREDRPQAEKEQMEQAQEEFVNDGEPPSRSKTS